MGPCTHTSSNDRDFLLNVRARITRRKQDLSISTSLADLNQFSEITLHLRKRVVLVEIKKRCQFVVTVLSCFDDCRVMVQRYEIVVEISRDLKYHWIRSPKILKNVKQQGTFQQFNVLCTRFCSFLRSISFSVYFGRIDLITRGNTENA